MTNCIVALLAGHFLCALTPAPDPSPAATHAGPEAQVKDMVDSAVQRGSKVILKRVDYAPGGLAPADNEGQLRSKTYIEIDTRPGGSINERELLQSQQKVEESQQEMIRAVDSIGEGQQRVDATLGSVEGRQREAAGGMKSAAGEQGAIRGEAANAAGVVGDTDQAVQESGALLHQIRSQARDLSGTMDDLSSRVDAEGGAKAPAHLSPDGGEGK
ncbi:MAG: hypothetical protein NT045_09070 [Candidatus Aureabacteria bacterium]|nr:hypothetical protein [Candidatus Auribacterota bacterium]